MNENKRGAIFPELTISPAPTFIGAERERQELARLRIQATLGALCFSWLGITRYLAGSDLLPLSGLFLFYYASLAYGYLDIQRRPVRDLRVYLLILLDCAMLAVGVWMDRGPDSPIFFCYIIMQGAVVVRFPGRFSAFASAASITSYSTAIALYAGGAPGQAGWANDWPMEAAKLLTLILLPLILRPLVARQIRLREQIYSVADKLSTFHAGEDKLAFDREGEDVVLALKRHLERLSSTIIGNQRSIEGRASMLEGQVEESLRLLRDEMERAQTSDRQKTEFLNMLNHELRTPLHHIMGFAELLEKQAPAGDSAARMVSIIKSRARELFENLEKLTKLSTITSNDRSLEFNPVNISDLIRETIESLTAAAAKKNIMIIHGVEGEIRNLLVDYEVIRDILRELMSNAIKFSPDGSEVTLKMAYDGALLTMNVTDQGEGFAGQNGEAPSIGLFQQADGGLNRKFEGLGVGLFFVQRLVSLHGGTIEIVNRPEGGAVFTVTIPAEPFTGFRGQNPPDSAG